MSEETEVQAEAPLLLFGGGNLTVDVQTGEETTSATAATVEALKVSA